MFSILLLVASLYQPMIPQLTNNSLSNLIKEPQSNIPNDIPQIFPKLTNPQSVIKPKQNVPITTTQAELKCQPRVQLIARIKEKSHAAPLFVGINSDKLAEEFWIDTEHPGLWINFFTKSDGIACIIGQGNNYGLAEKPVYVPSQEELLQQQEEDKESFKKREKKEFDDSFMTQHEASLKTINHDHS